MNESNPAIRAMKNWRLTDKELFEFHIHLKDQERLKKYILGKHYEEETPELVTIAETLDETKRRLAEGNMKGLSTGYQSLDDMTSGMRAGDIIVVYGDTGMMKSVLVQNITLNVVSQDIPVLFISTELTVDDNNERFLQMHGQDDVGKLPIIYPKEMPDFDKVRGQIKYAVQENGVKLVVIDLLHMFETAGENEQAVISRMCRQLKKTAVDFEVPIILVAHTNEDKYRKGVPELSALKGSSSIKQVATNALAVWRDKEKQEHLQKLIVKNQKNRRPIKRRSTELSILPNARLADAHIGPFPGR